MTGALIILLVTVAIGLLLYVYDFKYHRSHTMRTDEGENADNRAESKHHGEICCGRHLICEKSLSPLPDEKITYYDDEELDRYAGKAPDEYSEKETEEIREVMTTLRPEDVAGWVRSMQLRGINIPTTLRDELIIMIND